MGRTTRILALTGLMACNGSEYTLNAPYGTYEEPEEHESGEMPAAALEDESCDVAVMWMEPADDARHVPIDGTYTVSFSDQVPTAAE